MEALLCWRGLLGTAACFGVESWWRRRGCIGGRLSFTALQTQKSISSDEIKPVVDDVDVDVDISESRYALVLLSQTALTLHLGMRGSMQERRLHCGVNYLVTT